ncbi:MAG: nitrite/sulfite reductase, partial [Proteobacteria bacterium]|nr:nitrite/sulfite reductase [Pseudomonadota bacterium]
MRPAVHSYSSDIPRRIKAAVAKYPAKLIANISLKPLGLPPGDVTSDQMDLIADLADEFSFAEIRVTHTQNLVLPHVESNRLPELYDRLVEGGLGTANIGLLSDS